MSACFFQTKWKFYITLLLLCVIERHEAIKPISECNQEIRSPSNAVKYGEFEFPGFENPQNLSIQCKIIFIARKDERVRLYFTKFQLRGTPPECNHEYLDLFTEVKDPRQHIIETPFGGRYCGAISPRVRISFYEIAVVILHTDYNYVDDGLVRGTYRFVRDAKYDVGKRRPQGKCGYSVKSSETRNGLFLSPTYPGIYPKNISCYWKFEGKAGQRIRLEFRDFDLFYGGAHCPFDNVKIYDGADHTSPLIGTYCGQQRHLVVFSSTSSVMVTFSTLERFANSQNRGFSGIFNFSESYLSLDFIHKNEAKNNNAEHIRGSECDQKILSKGRSRGTVFSPNYPFPYYPKVICRYFIYGLEDAQNLERVQITFQEQFDIPEIPDTRTNCSDGFLRLYIQGQETLRKYDSPDFVFCGKRIPPTVTSMGPRLLMVFSSGSSQGIGFKASYRFETEYRVPGTASPDGKCDFRYYSNSSNQGSFNSPRHPANYPSNLECKYTFMPEKDKVVQIVFNQFKVRTNETKTNTTGPSCTNDYVEIYHVFRNGTGISEQYHGRYCGTTTPGPIESKRGSIGLRVVLRTDHSEVYSGFQAEYYFKPRTPYFSDCGGNITNQDWGKITSPNWPKHYGSPSSNAFTCDWFIHVKPNHKILLWFHDFAVEGELTSRGCPAAVVRVWSDMNALPMELCGDAISEDQSQITSKGNDLRLTFITARKAVGAKGFSVIWTEIQDSEKCEDFLCKRNNFCISKSLHCNGFQNCGFGDHSDEERCTKVTEVNVLMLVGMTVGITSTITLVLCMWCRRKRFRSRENKKLPLHPHACERGARFASMENSPRNISPVISAQMHHLSCGSLRSESNV